VAVILLIGIFALAFGLPGLDLRTWLVVLFQTNAGVGSLPAEPLRAFNPLDVAALVLFALTVPGVWSVFRRVGRTWLVVMVALPFAGLALLIVTHLAGRSELMGDGLVIALFMLRSTDFRRLAYLGVSANALLLVGDFATADAKDPFVAVLVGAGYVLLLVWFALIGARLLDWPSRLHARS
jgi:hypothetical protein